MARNAVFLPRAVGARLASRNAPPATTPRQPAATYGMSTQWGKGIGSGRNEGMGLFTISRQTFEQLEAFIADCQGSMAKADAGIDMLVRTMVLVIKGYAQSRAAGPVAPRHRSNPALAGRIPVQRISGAYFAGWTQAKLGKGHWMVYNDSKEAWLIEYGIYQRTRRPVLKMSLLDMLRFIQTTRTAERFLDGILAPRRNARGQFASFESRVNNRSSSASRAAISPTAAPAIPNIVGPSGALPG
jgi:hypothetical protein